MGLEVTAALSIAGPIGDQDPPETAGEVAGAEETGACDGACTLPELPELLEPPESPAVLELPELPELLELPELVELDPLLGAAPELALLFVLWPWNDLAAATEMTPLSAIAPAMSHPLIRRIS